ncbi:MAG: DUF1272 domain-containing protein [Fluviicoccus sp.]|uniref:DUF1272 domain-containing protein n=1 Tax=Fluviicoccus sp. TaxID=2003552 RepID=UPI00271AFF21|nr:DUF1272 domain-containing protein [Fluviicoccus sp.]MDO8330967.1 DUF1272 domain-containing protein [Fluviicoccus sp.]
MLKMKNECEACHAATGLMDVAYICSFECTFCEACSTRMGHVCPNCQGTLVLRPTRQRSPLAVGVSQVKQKLLGK